MLVKCEICKEDVHLIGEGNPGHLATLFYEPLTLVCKACAAESADVKIDDTRPIQRAIINGVVFLDWVGAWLHSGSKEAAHLFR